MRNNKHITMGFALLFCAATMVADDLNIKVIGLFSKQAIVKINGKQRLLKIGESSPEGVKLISANSHKVVLKVHGKETDYFLSGGQAGGQFSAPKTPSVTLWPTKGMYLTPGTINDFPVDFLVDTGASSIVLNIATAKRIGLNYADGKPVMVVTASGKETARRFTLDKVQVGEIKLYNIMAVVLDGDEPSTALLGMTFLEQLDMNRTDERLDLKKRF